jgi:hypothetical protein
MSGEKRKTQRSAASNKSLSKGTGKISDSCERDARQCRNRAAELEATILRLLDSRGLGKSICPSEAAKSVGGEASQKDWKSLMEPTREVARKMAKAGMICITQKGKSVDVSLAKGPIRLRLSNPSE